MPVYHQSHVHRRCAYFYAQTYMDELMIPKRGWKRSYIILHSYDKRDREARDCRLPSPVAVLLPYTTVHAD